MSYFARQRNEENDDQTEEDQTVVNQWISFGSRVAIRIALHPFEYAKTLIQVHIHTYIHLVFI